MGMVITGLAASIAALALGIPVDMTASATASAATGYHACFTHGVSPNHLVASTHSANTYRTSALRCGSATTFGVLHIHHRHQPFNGTTQQCIKHVLTKALYEGTASGKDNVSYRISKGHLSAWVIVNTDKNNVVTAYTSRTGSGASNEWAACTSL